MNLNQAQLYSAVRWGLSIVVGSFLGSWLRDHGFPLDDSALTVFAGIAVAAINLAWGTFVHTDKNTVATAAAVVNVPPVEQAKVGIETPVTPSAK